MNKNIMIVTKPLYEKLQESGQPFRNLMYMLHQFVVEVEDNKFLVVKNSRSYEYDNKIIDPETLFTKVLYNEIEERKA